MGEGDPRHTKRSVPAPEPANPARAVAEGAEPRPAAEPAPKATGTTPPAIRQAAATHTPKAAGTMPPATRRAAAAHTPVLPSRPARPSAVQQLADAPLSSRTATLDDPLTTSLLAEVARRSRTVDVSPDQIDEAMDIELAEPGAPGDRDPDDSI